jgi:hypothetical protein
LRGGGEDALATVAAKTLIELMGIFLGVVVIRNLESICQSDNYAGVCWVKQAVK